MAASPRRRDDNPYRVAFDDEVTEAAPGSNRIRSNLRKAFPLPPDEVAIDERFKALLEAMAALDPDKGRKS